MLLRACKAVSIFLQSYKLVLNMTMANLQSLVVSVSDCSDRRRDSVIHVMTLFRARRHKHGEVGYHSTIAA